MSFLGRIVLSIFLILSLWWCMGCNDESKDSDAAVKSRKQAAGRRPDFRMMDENDFESPEENESTESDDDNRRRATYNRGMVSPINEANTREYIHNYLELLKGGTRTKPITLAQKYEVASRIDGGKFVHAFPNDHNEHVLLEMATPIALEQLGKRSSYASEKAFNRWQSSMSEKEKSAMVHVFVETLIHELHEMQQKQHNTISEDHA
jgi:hypothetical protein